MLKEKLRDFKLVLASGSPRRQHFFQLLDLDYTIEVRPVEEVFSEALQQGEITEYLSKLKATAFTDISEETIIITSDTIVWKDGKAIGKPKDKDEAVSMLQNLSGDKHTVFTSVCFTGYNYQRVVTDRTDVWFKKLTLEEINYYLSNYKPYDKAGSYGIQDWLGYIGIEKIEGCFFNVMGLPTRLVYKTLMDMADRQF